MHCPFHESQICRSCALLPLDYSQTLTIKSAALAELFPSVSIREFRTGDGAAGSRIRARLAVTGTLEQLQLGFYDDQHRIVPVDQCPLHHPLINRFTLQLPRIVRETRLAPYDMQTDRGELKFVVLTCSPTHEQLMVQFVLRSREAFDRIRSYWRRMTDSEKQTVPVMSINLQPARSSLISGSVELPVSEQTRLPIRFGTTELVFGPQSFLQTNYGVATALYADTSQLLLDHAAVNVLDLYCGAGAFSLTAGLRAASVLGIDVSADAIECATESARRNHIANAEFLRRSLDCFTGDELQGRSFDTIICNPPRRGLDAASVSLIEKIGPRHVLYSSCNPVTLQRDVNRLQAGYQLEHLTPFDMFPFTSHFEVLALLSSRA